MKFLVLIVIVLVVLWLARAPRREGERTASRRAGPPPGVPQQMIRCASCGVHLPRSDALPGPDGQLYCCAEHRVRGKA